MLGARRRPLHHSRYFWSLPRRLLRPQQRRNSRYPGAGRAGTNCRSCVEIRVSTMPAMEIFDAEAVDIVLCRRMAILRDAKVPLAGQHILIAEDESFIAFEL